MNSLWRQDFLERARDYLRAGLSLLLYAQAFLLGLFAIAFMFQFWTHLWSFLQRTVFAGDW